MNVFELFASISLDAKNFNQGLKEAGNGVKKAGQTIKGGLKTAAKVGTVATAAVGAAAAVAGKKVLNMANDTAQLGDRVDKMSQRIGISRKSFQELDYVFSQSGTNIDSLKMGLKTMRSVMDTTAQGTSKTKTALERLGISATDSKGQLRDSEEVMWESIKTLQNMKNKTEKARLASMLFGRAGADMMPLLNGTAGSIDELRKKANDLGMVMSDKAVNAARDYTDSMDTLKRTFTGVKNRIMSELLPSFKSIMDGFSGLLAGQKGAEGTFTKGVTSLVSSFSKVIPQVTTIITSIVKAVAEVAPSIISALVSGIVDNLPTLVNSAISIVSAIISSIMTALPKLVELLPALISSLTQLLSSIIEQLPTMIQQFITALIQQLPIIATALLNSMPILIQGFMNLISGLVASLPSIIQQLVNALPNVIKILIKTIISNIAMFIQGAIKLVVELVKALPQIILSLINAIPDIIDAIIDGFLGNIEQLILGFVKLNIELVKNLPRIILSLIKAVPKIVTSIVKAFTKLGGKFLGIGKNLVKGIWDGIAGMGKWLWDKVSGFFGGIVDKVKNFFGIKSPSRLFRDVIGKNLALGIGLGFADEMKNVSKQMQSALPTSFDTDLSMVSDIGYAENERSSQINQSFTVEVNNPVVREETDIQKLSEQINNELGKLFRQRDMAYG